MQSQESYPSDLTDIEWELMGPLIPGPQKLGRPARYEKRAILNAIFYVVRSGCSWRMLPRDLPPWRIVCSYFHDLARGRALGTVARNAARLRPAVPRQKKAPTAAILDAQSVKTSNHPGVRGYDAGKKVLGRKRHLVVDTRGFILGVLVTPASVTDRQGAAQLLPSVLLRHGWLRQLWADGGYSGSAWIEPLQELLPRRGLRLDIVKRSDHVQGFRVQPKRWIVERSFAWLTHARRLVKDYETKTENSTAFILIAASRLMLRRLAECF